jgi:hypothetical protein
LAPSSITTGDDTADWAFTPGLEMLGRGVVGGLGYDDNLGIIGDLEASWNMSVSNSTIIGLAMIQDADSGTTNISSIITSASISYSCADVDSDRDGTLSVNDNNDNDPCIPNADAEACQLLADTGFGTISNFAIGIMLMLAVLVVAHLSKNKVYQHKING